MTSKKVITLDNERASWVDQPDAGIRMSWRNRKKVVWLLDGAYFWYNWDPILDINERLCIPDKNIIVVHNPGTGKISKLLSDIMLWKVLAVLDKHGNPDTEVTFPEAENNGWIKEKNYISAWNYLGKRDIWELAVFYLRNKDVSLDVFQVTKKGVWKISLTERDIQRPNIFYFFGLRPRI